jgi:hypothetical protein
MRARPIPEPEPPKELPTGGVPEGEGLGVCSELPIGGMPEGEGLGVCSSVPFAAAAKPRAAWYPLRRSEPSNSLGGWDPTKLVVVGA